MKKLLVCLSLLALAGTLAAAEATWGTDLPKAKAQAKAEKKMVLMNFTGSDWCGWCKKLQAEVFTQDEFQQYAKDNLVLVEVDFPNKKEQSAALKKANEALGRDYKVRGYPTIVALNSEGKEVWRSPGYMPGGAKAWIAKLKAAQGGTGK